MVDTAHPLGLRIEYLCFYFPEYVLFTSRIVWKDSLQSGPMGAQHSRRSEKGASEVSDQLYWYNIKLYSLIGLQKRTSHVCWCYWNLSNSPNCKF